MVKPALLKGHYSVISFQPLHLALCFQAHQLPAGVEKTIELSFNGCLFTWTFFLAAVQFLILGVRFLAARFLPTPCRQIPVYTFNVSNMAITTPFRVFKYWRMANRLRNINNTFEGMMDCILSGPSSDSSILMISLYEQNLDHLIQLFQHLQAHGTFNLEKNMFLCCWVG